MNDNRERVPGYVPMTAHKINPHYSSQQKNGAGGRRNGGRGVRRRNGARYSRGDAGVQSRVQTRSEYKE